ncbi:MAG: SWIM zinc finger family protein [Candidatus Riflebacteria bacterium]|nr:SWIM zinc finger family protein [Candidatus Riflebacteria bacterium]
MDKLRKRGHPVSPVEIAGRTIASTFWGKAWCDNLESYSDFENRLPRGRTYVRNGSVVDLQIRAGEVKAYVSGSELYTVTVKVAPVVPAQWTSICRDCTGGIDSLVELLQGRFSKGVMQRICQQRSGLFPAPAQIKFSCSCPDSAYMCKHVAAVLYGIGARLDVKPELLFSLRQVHERDLIARAGAGVPLTRKGPAAEKVLATDELPELFGLDLAPTAVAGAAPTRKQAADRRSTGRRPAAAKPARRPRGGKGAKPATSPRVRKAAKPTTSPRGRATPAPKTTKRPTRAKTTRRTTATPRARDLPAPGRSRAALRRRRSRGGSR